MSGSLQREGERGAAEQRVPAVDVSVVIPSYNTRDLMEQALRTVMEAAVDLEVEIVVVDNASRDGSAEMVEEKFPQVELVRNEKNVGFAAANNVAFGRTRGRYVLLLNSDTVVRPDTLRCLVKFLDDRPEAGAAGCKILNPDGTLQLESRRSFPTPAAAVWKLTGMSRLFPNSPRFAHYNLTYLDPEEVNEVDALSGSCMMVRREVIEQVGQLDEAYFMYGEDLDWCYRMRQAGWQIYYVPHTAIIHFRGQSGRAEEMRVQYRKNESMAIFAQKHMRKTYRFFPLWLLHAGIVIYGIYSFIAPLSRRLALPALDGLLVLTGLQLGVTIRYHPDLIPMMESIQAVGSQFGVDVHPTRWLTPPPYSEPQWSVFYGSSTVLWLFAFYLLGLYDRHKYSTRRAAIAVALGFAFIVTAVFFFKEYNFSRLATAAAWAFNTALVSGWRLVVAWFLRTSRGRRLGRRRTLVVGTDGPAVQLLAYLERVGGLDCELVGVVAEERDAVGREIAGVGVVGSVEELARLVREYEVNEVLFTPETISHSLGRVGRKGRKLRLRMVPGSLGDVDDKSVASIDDLPLIEIR